MYKLAVIGDSETVLAFKAVGFDTFQVSRAEAASVLQEKHHSGKYALIFVSESLARDMETLLEEYGKLPFPAVSVLPLGVKSEHLGIALLRRTSIRATGADIVSKMK
jgi:V/A-type H+-transporting ATPase subunit F